MPFSSKKQQRFMYAQKAAGNLPNVDLKEWAAATDFKHLPESESNDNSNKMPKMKNMMKKKKAPSVL
jgi:hypothetical protein